MGARAGPSIKRWVLAQPASSSTTDSRVKPILAMERLRRRRQMPPLPMVARLRPRWARPGSAGAPGDVPGSGSQSQCCDSQGMPSPSPSILVSGQLRMK